MERCPQCRARLKGQMICGRCGVDLGLVLTVEQQAKNMARLSVQALNGGDVARAAALADKACRRHASAFHVALREFVRKIARESV